MELPLRMVCSECGRSVTWSKDDVPRAPSSCTICGGQLDSASNDAQFHLATMTTPASLQLTPEELGDEVWARETDDGGLTKVGRFQLRELIGNGGFGYVYRAFDARLEREVALKVLRDSHPPARVIERFFREARAASQVDHPNIVSLFDAGRDEGKCWIAYQFVDGCTLARYRERNPCDARKTAIMIRALADALAHAHDRGVYHRDLKPANILIDTQDRPRLTDFGLARRIDFEPTMTHEGAILGTANYMSPEQASGKSHQADGRSDLYSLGVIFYEMLCGRRPVDLPSNAPSWRTMTDRSGVKSPRTRNRKIPRELAEICLRTLAKNPDDRYPNARMMTEDLDRWLANAPSGASRSLLVAGVLLLGLVSRESAGLIAKKWNLHEPAVSNAVKPEVSPEIASSESLDAPPVMPQDALPSRPVGNSATHVFHLFADCPAVKSMADDHKIQFADRAAAEQQNYQLCERCERREKKVTKTGGP